MNKVYNTQEDFAREISNFLLNVSPNIRKTQLNIIPYIVLGMILSESVVSSDIAKKLKGSFSFLQLNSVIKRIRRFFKNKLFNPYFFYDSVIHYVISHYKKKHEDKRVHIIFDHMFSHDNYSVFMLTMRIGKQSIPLWFRCFRHISSDAFQESLLLEGISYVSNLFGKDFDLIFLADRWFNSVNLLNHIDSLGHTYCIRLKRNIKVFVFNEKENHFIRRWLNQLETYEFKSKVYRNILLSEEQYQTNIVFSKRHQIEEPWIIVTNGNPNRAIKDYGYRFGGIESGFKNQKSNGLYLENTVNASLEYFTSMYTLACFTQLFLTILGAEYSKNSRCYKNVRLTTHQSKTSKTRVMSLFQVGLTLFNLAFNSFKYIRIPYRFILYDI